MPVTSRVVAVPPSEPTRLSVAPPKVCARTVPPAAPPTSGRWSIRRVTGGAPVAMSYTVADLAGVSYVSWLTTTTVSEPEPRTRP